MAPATTCAWPSSSAARRCTEPMKAPRPPPTMPARRRRSGGADVAVGHIALNASAFRRPCPLRSRRALSPREEPLDVRVGKRRLAAVDVVQQCLVHGRVERRRLVFLELLLPLGVSALDHVLGAFRLPLLDAVVV